MLRLAIPAVCAAALFAQNPDNPFERPPAGVEEALRARMTEFFQAHMKGEFRKAETLVAEETKDWFYEHNKPKYLSFEIRSITFSDNFTKAQSTVLCEQLIPFPGFAGKPMKVPTATNWKLVDGKWYWYLPEEALKGFPFGKIAPKENAAMVPGTPGPPPSTTAGLPDLGSIPTSADFILNKVKADRNSIELKRGGVETVTFHNAAPGYMALEVTDQLRGVTMTPARTSLAAGQDAQFTIKAADEAQGGVIHVRIDPTKEIVAIKVVVVK